MVMMLLHDGAVGNVGEADFGVGDKLSRQQQLRQVDRRRPGRDHPSRGGEQRTEGLQFRRRRSTRRRQLRHARSMQLPLRHRAARST